MLEFLKSERGSSPHEMALIVGIMAAGMVVVWQMVGVPDWMPGYLTWMND